MPRSISDIEIQIEKTIKQQLRLGEDLIQVSSHKGACPLCEPWQGAVLSISGNHPTYPALADAKAAGLFHPNCAHVVMPYSERYALE